MDTFAQRFKAARELKGLSQRELARRVGLTGSAISQWESGETQPENIGASALEKAAQQVGRSVRYLLTGRDLGSGVAEEKHAYLRPLTFWNDPKDLPADQFVMLPALDYYLSAGTGGPDPSAVEQTDKGAAFRADFAAAEGWTSRTHFTMRAKGDSMEPTVQDGAPVVIATSEKTIRSGRIYALLLDGEPLLKRLDRLPGGMIRVRSDNTSDPAYSAFEVREDVIEVIGRAVWTPVRL
jgi:phage repressor protein C with HTH and peptisase S24 domain